MAIAIAAEAAEVAGAAGIAGRGGTIAGDGRLSSLNKTMPPVNIAGGFHLAGTQAIRRRGRRFSRNAPAASKAKPAGSGTETDNISIAPLGPGPI